MFTENNKKFHQSLKTFIESFNNLEILTKIDFDTDFICIKVDKFPYKSQFRKNLTRVYDLWQYFGSALVNTYYKKYQKGLIPCFSSD